ncbi:unnamed protein product [Adineta ricciae]|uniref:Uncharacterized protein n=1 Tax=Adineta ricciae TaxID=249248 RepID=A0A813NF56_ADIRI|nr:unnamed protein product [Adineta ricciae]
MDQGEYLYSGHAWLKEHLNGVDGPLWKKARKLFLFNMELSSALNLFKFDYRAIQRISRPEGVIIIGSKKIDLDPDEPREHQPGHSWTDDAQQSIRTLMDRIVTRWIPNYIFHDKINMNKLHQSLTHDPLQFVRKTYDETSVDVLSYNVNEAFKLYQACLVPLHYHELWSEIVNDCKNVVTKLEDRETEIDATLFYDRPTLDGRTQAALIFGTNRVTFDDGYRPLTRKLGLFDLVLITINGRSYFGIVVHVEQVKVKDYNGHDTSSDISNNNNLKFDLHTTIGIYVSETCSKSVENYREQNNNEKLKIKKLSNITSSRRIISAVHSLNEWQQYRSLLKPTIDDPYFQYPEEYDPVYTTPENNFNLAQSKAINIAKCMLGDIQERMHLIHGPPGTGKSRTIAGIVLKLLAKLDSKHKILLCAPSNNACDELSRRVLDEFTNQGVSYKRGTLVRIGCQPPDDYSLCDHFLDFMVLQDIVDFLKTDQKYSPKIAHETESRLIRHAKIIVSTLNYCGSARMHQLKSCTEFIIIDEACQSSEADSLLPFRFRCKKIVLVGDPQQLPPCVLSDAGKAYGLSQSLYSRLYFQFYNSSNCPITMLDIQYRMHPDICQFPSEYFYSNRLLPDSSVEEKMKDFPLKPLFAYNITNSSHQYDGAKSSFNVNEVQCIQNFCQNLIAYFVSQSTSDSSSDITDEDDGECSVFSESDSTFSSNTDNGSLRDQEIQPQALQHLPYNDPRSIFVQKTIAVITPYKAQVRLLGQHLPPYIEVMTVDSAQGKEKDIVILSCVRSGGSIGFLDDMNRVNVMLTRSKKALYVFGNLSQLASQHESWKEFLAHVHRQQVISDANNLQVDLPCR